MNQMVQDLKWYIEIIRIRLPENIGRTDLTDWQQQ